MIKLSSKVIQVVEKGEMTMKRVFVIYKQWFLENEDEDVQMIVIYFL